MTNQNIIGIRREDTKLLEKRAPLTPLHIKQLFEYNIKVIVQPSKERIFSEKQYQEAGAEINEDLSKCNIIIGVKEIPINEILPNKTYLFFSHTLKKQKYNMPMLKVLSEKKATLIDYELIKNENEKRLVFFGDYAGYAGIINTLWAFGRRIYWEGNNTLFKSVKQTIKYESLEEVKEAVRQVGINIKTRGTYPNISPIVIGVTGRGRVSKGVMEILNLLPVVDIPLNKLKELIINGKFSRNFIYVVRLLKHDLYKPKDESLQFDSKYFNKHPDEFTSNIEQYFPYFSIFVNGIYWEAKYPKLLTKKFLKKYFLSGKVNRLKVIGDITCDIDGSIESTVKATDWTNPLYVFNPLDESVKNGWEGNGIVMMTVDKLPTELPNEASNFFGNSLLQFLIDISKTDFTKKYEELNLPIEFRDAVILHKGQLIEKYSYLKNEITNLT